MATSRGEASARQGPSSGDPRRNMARGARSYDRQRNSKDTPLRHPVPSRDERAVARTIMVAPMTTGGRPAPSRIPVLFQRKAGFILLEQIRTLDKSRLIRRLGAPNGPQPRRSYGEAAECASPFRPTPAAIQYAELDPGPVDPAPHDPVERIDLAHKVPLAEPADRRVARHLADRRPLVRQQQVRAPSRAAAAASHPACPPPTTTTSHVSMVSLMARSFTVATPLCRAFH